MQIYFQIYFQLPLLIFIKGENVSEGHCSSILKSIM